MSSSTAADPFLLRRSRFAELTPFEVYALCRLRVDVFVVEQECPYPELDGRDTEPTTMHLWLESDGEVAATIRVLDDGATRAIGRVATAAGFRGRGLAARLMGEGIALCEGFPITLGAQAHLEGWYERFGFRRSGPGYVEDGIPHVPMLREPGRALRRMATVDARTQLLAAAERLELLATRTTRGDWRLRGLLATRPEVIASAADGGTQHVADARERTGEWIAALSPDLAAPLAAWLRATAAGDAVDDAAADVARTLLRRLP